jgi:hypothetical protein
MTVLFMGGLEQELLPQCSKIIEHLDISNILEF